MMFVKRAFQVEFSETEGMIELKRQTDATAKTARKISSFLIIREVPPTGSTAPLCRPAAFLLLDH